LKSAKASPASKPGKTERGPEVQVPPIANESESVRVDTQEGGAPVAGYTPNLNQSRQPSELWSDGFLLLVLAALAVQEVD